MKNPIKIQQGQIIRLLTYSLLHANITHLVLNLIVQVIIGSYLEYIIGTIKYITLYFISGILGGLFSCLISSSNSVGASVCIFGLLGAYVGYFFMNWNYFDRVLGTCSKYINFIFILFSILICFCFNLSDPNIDNWGHFGGLIFGFCLIYLLNKSKEDNDGLCCSNETWKYVMIGVLLVYSVCGFTLLYLVKNYN